jgi:hypothetical protein
MGEVTREAVIDAAKRAAAQADGPISLDSFVRLTGISTYHVYHLFPDGGWLEVKAAAGLERHPKHKNPLSDDELLGEYHRVVAALGAVPTWDRFAARATVSAEVLKHRFGGRRGTLKRYRGWLEQHEPNSPFLKELQSESMRELPTAPSAPVSAIQPAWSKNVGTVFGPPIDFRGLRHAPINEQGVVFLFGMVSYEIGFIVEAIHAAYPDCEAKRCVDRRNNRWQRVRIEFEFRSSNFRDHGHDPGGCDVIVCWQHDWPDCPLEVVELHRVINDLGR